MNKEIILQTTKHILSIMLTAAIAAGLAAVKQIVEQKVGICTATPSPETAMLLGGGLRGGLSLIKLFGGKSLV